MPGSRTSTWLGAPHRLCGEAPAAYQRSTRRKLARRQALQQRLLLQCWSTSLGSVWAHCSSCARALGWDPTGVLCSVDAGHETRLGPTWACAGACAWALSARGCAALMDPGYPAPVGASQGRGPCPLSLEMCLFLNSRPPFGRSLSFFLSFKGKAKRGGPGPAPAGGAGRAAGPP